MPKRNGTARALKAERLARGISRSELDRERERKLRNAPGRPRPQFWWVSGVRR